MNMARGSWSIGGLELSGSGEYGLLIVLGVLAALLDWVGQTTNDVLAMDIAVVCAIAFALVLGILFLTFSMIICRFQDPVLSAT